ncbi:receptor-like protein 53 [Capsicum galapagoense]
MNLIKYGATIDPKVHLTHISLSFKQGNLPPNLLPLHNTHSKLTWLTRKPQWSFAMSVCHWVGVTCGSHHQRVKSLILSNMALEGRIPHEFGNLTFLVSLDLRRNNFHGNLPQEMARLCWLKFLDSSVNIFSGEVPSWFGFLHQLQVLNLRNNSFTGSIPCSFSNISKLDTLNLNFNSIEGQIPKVIGNLRELKLRGNNLIGSIPLSLSNASSLSGSLPNGLCNGLPILKGLYLSSNKLRGHMPTTSNFVFIGQ